MNYKLMDFTLTQKQLLVLRALLIAVFILFILNFLEPFQIHSDGSDFRFISLLAGYGMIGGSIILLNEWKIVPFSRTFITYQKLALATEYLWQLLSVAVGICWYSRFLHAHYPVYNFPYFSYWEALEKTFLIGVIPISIDLVSQYVKQQKQTPIILPKLLHLKGELTNDWLKIKPEQLLFITSSDNYVNVHYLENQIVHKKLLRATLKSMETQLQDFPIHRCHQSFIINLTLVRSIKGNSRAMQLELLHWESKIPISRKYIPMITKELNSLNQLAS